jgi:hypothetical protein
MIEAAAKGAVKPDAVTDDMLRSIGCCALRDMGGEINYIRYEYLHSCCLASNSKSRRSLSNRHSFLTTTDTHLFDFFFFLFFLLVGNSGLAWSTRIGSFFVPYNFFTELFAFAAPFMPDWKTHNKNR